MWQNPIQLSDSLTKTKNKINIAMTNKTKTNKTNGMTNLIREIFTISLH